MRKNITLDEAKEKFPFVSKLPLDQPQIASIYYTELEDLATERPSTLEDHTVHHGCERWQLFVVGNDECPHEVDIHLGRTVIYQARNMNPREERDDIYESGESVEEALSRYKSHFEFVALHGYGCTRSGNEFEKLIIAKTHEKNI